MHLSTTTHFTRFRTTRSFGTSNDWKDVCSGKRLEKGMQAAKSMLQQGKPISKDVAYCLLQGCSRNRNLEAAKLVFSFISSSKLELVAPLGDPLIRLFASHGQLAAASQMFERIKIRSSHSWHAIIFAHVAAHEHAESLSLYYHMLDSGFQPSKFIYSCILKACACAAYLCQGMVVHKQVAEAGFDVDVVVGSAAIGLYAKCGCLEEAHRAFNHVKVRNVVSYNTLMAGYVQQGEGMLAWELYKKLQRDGLEPDHFTFSCILKACGISKSITQGASVHEEILARGIEQNVVVANALIDMYFKCGNLTKAQEVFMEMSKKDVVSWNTFLMGYNCSGLGFEALEMFEKMQEEEVTPNKVTYICLLKACCIIDALYEGRWVHNKVITSSLVSDMEIGSALVFMYAQCGYLPDAHCVFNNLLTKDVVLWCTMIAAYTQHGCSYVALEIYEKMKVEDVSPDGATFTCILKACANVNALCKGRSVHERVLACGLAYDVAVRNTLINMYMNCGCIDEACKLFEDFPHKNAVTWDIMITGYTQNELDFSALELFEKMLSEGFKPDNVSFVCALKASGLTRSILQGRLIHDHMIREGLETDSTVGNSLIDMYAKCSSLSEAYRMFELVRERNLASWGALISGYAQKDGWRSADEHLDLMQRHGFEQGAVMYTSVLAACSQAGNIVDGKKHFTSAMKDTKTALGLQHYNCMIDLFCRTGCVDEAERLLQTMPISPDVFGWTSLLSACKNYGYSDSRRE